MFAVGQYLMDTSAPIVRRERTTLENGGANEQQCLPTPSSGSFHEIPREAPRPPTSSADREPYDSFDVVNGRLRLFLDDLWGLAEVSSQSD